MNPKAQEYSVIGRGVHGSGWANFDENENLPVGFRGFFEFFETPLSGSSQVGF